MSKLFASLALAKATMQDGVKDVGNFLPGMRCAPLVPGAINNIQGTQFPLSQLFLMPELIRAGQPLNYVNLATKTDMTHTLVQISKAPGTK